MHFKTFLCHLVRSVLFQSNLWSVTASTEVHSTFTPAETGDLRITGHRAGQDVRMNGTLAPLAYKNFVCVSPLVFVDPVNRPVFHLCFNFVFR